MIASCRRFNKGGPSAVANFDSGVAGFEARAFRGLGVFTSTPVRLCLARRTHPGAPCRDHSDRRAPFSRAVRGLGRRGFDADAAALHAGGRVLLHDVAAGAVERCGQGQAPQLPRYARVVRRSEHTALQTSVSSAHRVRACVSACNSQTSSSTTRRPTSTCTSPLRRPALRRASPVMRRSKMGVIALRLCRRGAAARPRPLPRLTTPRVARTSPASASSSCAPSSST